MKLINEWTFEGDLKSIGEYGTSGTEPVINQECMLVHEKEDSTCQFEWYRDNNTHYYRLKQKLEAVFFALARIVSIFQGRRSLCLHKREHSLKNIRGLPATERRSLEVLTIRIVKCEAQEGARCACTKESIPRKIFAGCPRLRGEATKCSRFEAITIRIV